MTNLDIVKDYQKIVVSLAVAKSLLHMKELRLNKLIYPNGGYHSPSFEFTLKESKADKPTIEQYDEIIKLNGEISTQKDHVKNLEEEKDKLDREIEVVAKKCKDLELKVFLYHYVKRLSLRETARIMSYSYPGIRKIHNKLKKM